MLWAIPHRDCDIVLSTQADIIEQGGHRKSKDRHNVGQAQKSTADEKIDKKTFSNKIRLNCTNKKRKKHMNEVRSKPLLKTPCRTSYA